MPWRVANALEMLRRQYNATYPERSKEGDGAIGDEAHQSRHSDHNAWIEDGKMRVVSARDFTHDPLHGFNAGVRARQLVATRDPRIKYVISNGEISTPNFGWKRYGGPNPHRHHFHISVKATKSLYDDTRPWDIGSIGASVPSAPLVQEYTILRQGMSGKKVGEWQRIIRVAVDEDFGSATKAGTITFQKAHKLVADGIVGRATWEAAKGK